MEPPGGFSRFARKNGAQKHEGKAIDVVYGIKEGTSSIQALRFPKEKWSAEEARAVCKERGGSFEAASKDSVDDSADYEVIDAMGLKVYRAAVAHAKSLIADGKVDKGDDWSFSAEDGNALLGKDSNWKAYALWHLAQDTAEPQETKGRYKYPVGKGGKVYRKGVIAAKSRAAGQGEDAVSNAAAGLLDLIDREEDEADATVDPPGKEKQKPQPGNATAGTLQDEKECPDCKGTGKVNGKTCETCGGTGRVEKEEEDATAPHAVSSPATPVSSQATLEKQQAAKVGQPRDPAKQGGADKRDSRGHLLTASGVQRWDRVMAPDWMSEPFTKTPEGFLKGRAIITSTGVFPYKDATGNIRRELRLPEEVFHGDHLDSLKLKPVTNEHPSEEVTPENIGKYQVGQLGTNPSSTHEAADWNRGPWRERTDGYHLACDMLITNKDAIADVEAGKRQLSCGYTCDLEKADDGANHMGMGYDFVQRNIRLNHVAIVDRARAGDAARIRLDSADAELVIQEGAMKEITLDGAIKFQVDDKVAEAFAKATARADTADAALKTASETIAKEKARADAAEAELKKAKDPATIKAAVDAAVRLENGAYLAEVKRDEKMTEIDVMKAVILKTDPAANFEGKDVVYIQARFDAAVAILEAQAGALGAAVRRGGPSVGGEKDGSRDDESMYDAEAHRKAMIKRMHADSRGEVGTNRSNVHLEKDKFAAGYPALVQ